MLIGSNSTKESDMVIEELASLFDITDNGEPNFHLGCRITRDCKHRTIHLDQSTYTQSILRQFNFENCNSVATPMDPGCRLFADTEPLSPEEQ
jgi:hypothetical protein